MPKNTLFKFGECGARRRVALYLQQLRAFPRFPPSSDAKQTAVKNGESPALKMEKRRIFLHFILYTTTKKCYHYYCAK